MNKKMSASRLLECIGIPSEQAEKQFEACERIDRIPQVAKSLEGAPINVIMCGVLSDGDPVALVKVSIMEGADSYRNFMISQGVDVLAIEDKFFADRPEEE